MTLVMRLKSSNYFNFGRKYNYTQITEYFYPAQMFALLSNTVASWFSLSNLGKILDNEKINLRIHRNFP